MLLKMYLVTILLDCKLMYSNPSRVSRRRCCIKKDVLGNFAKFTGKYLCQSLVFNKVAGLRSAILLIKGI